jgi:N-acetylmuramic acid 6-phosphate (MurNAc-6-P) etherase
MQQQNGTNPKLVTGRSNTISSITCHNKQQHYKIWDTTLHTLSYAIIINIEGYETNSNKQKLGLNLLQGR